MADFLVFSCLLVIPLIWGTKQKERTAFMGIEFTTVIKGASILSVVWAHSCARLHIGGIQFIAGIGVALFLICSGYGLEVSYSKNKLNGFWRKRILRLCIPFWIVQIVGMAVIGELTLPNLVSALLFIRGNWFIRYIIVCYIIFYVCKQLAERYKIKENCEVAILCSAFGCWFVIESIFLANPGMPFLEARQMISFPFGIMLAKKTSSLLNLFNKNRTIIFGGGIGILFMLLSQLDVIKSAPYLVSNLLSLFTVLPLALTTIGVLNHCRILCTSKYLMFLGTSSYEIFLIHGQMEYMIGDSWLSAILVLIGTIVLAMSLHALLKIKINK